MKKTIIISVVVAGVLAVTAVAFTLSIVRDDAETTETAIAVPSSTEERVEPQTPSSTALTTVAPTTTESAAFPTATAAVYSATTAAPLEESNYTFETNLGELTNLHYECLLSYNEFQAASSAMRTREDPDASWSSWGAWGTWEDMVRGNYSWRRMIDNWTWALDNTEPGWVDAIYRARRLLIRLEDRFTRIEVLRFGKAKARQLALDAASEIPGRESYSPDETLCPGIALHIPNTDAMQDPTYY